MGNNQLGIMEARFAQIIWDNEPISSGELVKICEKELDWKKSTTYTMLKRLCNRGIFQNSGGTVKRVLSKEEFLSKQSEDFINENYGGSLPLFLAAFSSGKKLGSKEIASLQELIDRHKED